MSCILGNSNQIEWIYSTSYYALVCQQWNIWSFAYCYVKWIRQHAERFGGAEEIRFFFSSQFEQCFTAQWIDGVGKEKERIASVTTLRISDRIQGNSTFSDV